MFARIVFEIDSLWKVSTLFQEIYYLLWKFQKACCPCVLTLLLPIETYTSNKSIYPQNTALSLPRAFNDI